jgi:acetyl-CoA synthetase
MSELWLLLCIIQKPGSATLPFFGVVPAVVDEKGNELEGACEGYLCIKQVPS